jgi:hypothetical protein
MSEPATALSELATVLRDQGSVISPHVADPGERPALGELAASGRRASGAPGVYALVVEAVREGYLLHYGTPRVVAGIDSDLALLAGDYLYALGLERLAALGDLEAVRELSDLISLAAEVHDGSRPEERADREAGALWLACATAIAAGASPAHEQAKSALRAGAEGADAALRSAAADGAARGGIEEGLRRASDAIDFRPQPLS